MDLPCLSCDTAILPGEETRPMLYVNDTGTHERQVHVECGLRDVVGGWGHLTDHVYWCRLMHDPDGGLPLRESALRVWAWVNDHGVEAAVRIGSN